MRLRPGVAGSGTVPTDTFTAALNMAHYPAANVGALYGLVNGQSPFVGLGTQPNDFTLALTFGTGTQLLSPGVPAVDANGNVWFGSTLPDVNFLGINLYAAEELSPAGAPVSGSLVQIGHPGTQAAIDPAGNPWIAQSSGGVVTKVTGNTVTSYSYNGSSNDDGHQIAIDGSGNVYISDNTNGSLYELNNSGMVNGSAIFSAGNASGEGLHGVALLNSTTALTINNTESLQEDAVPLTGALKACNSPGSACRGGGLASPTALAVDGAANVWALNSNSTLSGFTPGGGNPAGGYITGSPFSGGGLNTTTVSATQPYPWLAIDGANKIWIANYTGVLSEFSNAGVPLSPATGLYGSAANCKGQGLAIDGSGNLWVSCDSATAPVMEYIGAATPVVTPLTPGVAAPPP